jgi:putative flippase GtrA
VTQGLWFIAVGICAALIHLLIFTWLTHATINILRPELANAAGFLVAFLVSFTGHRALSFENAGTTVRQSFLRFVITALAGFISNEITFVLLLRYAKLDPTLALLIAMVIAAGQTFILSRLWVFRR